MGSMIHLAVGRLELEWGKNNGFVDHSMLFQGETDVSDVPYYYAKGENQDDGIDVVLKEGLSRPLELVVERLKLLGHTESAAKAEYEDLSELNGFSLTDYPFELLKAALQDVDVMSMSANYGDGGEDLGKFFRREIAPRIGLDAADYEFAQGMENLSSWSILLLLAANPKAHDLPVMWSYQDIEMGGWAPRSTFVRELDQHNKFLIVTEGSSDARIIRHALRLLNPNIADFFRFVDMEEGYPFSGTGNLFRFVRGLVSIAVTNNILVVLDNDAAGVAVLERFANLGLPSNIRVLKLPELEEFKSFPTVGPTGTANTDINGKAAAIECYLELDSVAKVRWGGFNDEADVYQGALIGKERVARKFLSQRRKLDNYDYSKLERILGELVAVASDMSKVSG